ncbi:MAG: hypothetical protein LBV72_01670 [Tannerella sp.]|nr:hypothetical protein [Tannerella sp.]
MGNITANREFAKRIHCTTNGYFRCKTDYHLPLDAFEEKIKNFTQNIRCESLNLTGDFVTWDRLYRYDRNWSSWGQIEEQSGKEMVEHFWIDLEKFIGETLE